MDDAMTGFLILLNALFVAVQGYFVHTHTLEGNTTSALISGGFVLMHLLLISMLAGSAR